MMKKIISRLFHKRVLTVSLLCISFLIAVLLTNKNAIKQIYAQVTFDTPVTFSGSNSVSAPQFIDTANSSYYLDPAATGNSLLVAGNVGIGTTGPGANLDVKPSADSTSVFRVQNAAGAGIARVDTTNGQLVLGSTVKGQLQLSNASNNSGFVISNTGGTGASILQFTKDATDVVTITNTGNVGIGTTNPGQKLSVAGTVESTSGGFKFPDGTTQTTVASGVPSGAVMFFNLTACPSGWTALTAAAGYAIVGRAANESIGSTVGTALSSLENRTHTHTGPSHTHSVPSAPGTAGQSGYAVAYYWDPVPGGYIVTSNWNTGAAGTGSTGTAATSDVIPYIQLLVCQKS